MGSLLTFAAYSMKTMLPLRTVAVCANVCFLTYGYFSGVWQVAILHAALLPFNGWRLSEILLLRSRLAARQRVGLSDFSVLRAYGKPLRVEPGQLIFSKGDSPDLMYYIESGRIEIEELGITLGKGEIFGEISFFTEAQERTASARAIETCQLRCLDDKVFLKLYYQDPLFGVAIMRTITRRLIDGMSQAPQVYTPQAMAETHP